MSPQERDRFLAGRHVAVLVTTDSEGRPVPTPIWYLCRDGLLYFRTEAASAKVANVRRDSHVSVCVQEERLPYKAVIVHGTAAVQDDPGGSPGTRHGTIWASSERSAISRRRRARSRWGRRWPSSSRRSALRAGTTRKRRPGSRP